MKFCLLNILAMTETLRQVWDSSEEIQGFESLILAIRLSHPNIYSSASGDRLIFHERILS